MYNNNIRTDSEIHQFINSEFRNDRSRLEWPLLAPFQILYCCTHTNNLLLLTAATQPECLINIGFETAHILTLVVLRTTVGDTSDFHYHTHNTVLLLLQIMHYCLLF